MTRFGKTLEILTLPADRHERLPNASDEVTGIVNDRCIGKYILSPLHSNFHERVRSNGGDGCENRE